MANNLQLIVKAARYKVMQQENEKFKIQRSNALSNGVSVGKDVGIRYIECLGHKETLLIFS